MRILVTGHCGYIGSVLVPMLQERGHDVIGLDSDLFALCTFAGSMPDVAGIRKDIRDVDAMDLRGFDAVIHLAGLSNDPLGSYRPELTRQINFEATIRLATLARASGAGRFLFASSCSNYGEAGEDVLDESAPFRPVTPYGVSKVRSEEALASLADDSFSPTFLRAGTAYGLSPRIRFDLVVNNLTAWAFTTGSVLLKSDGMAWRPLVHVEDLARAYVAALEAPRERVHGRAYNVGRPTENYRIRDVAEIVLGVVPDSRVEFADGAAADTRCYRVSCDRIARELPAYRPSWTVRAGVEQLYRAYRRVGLSVDDFEGPRFRRISHIRQLVSDGLLDESLRWRLRGAERATPLRAAVSAHRRARGAVRAAGEIR